MSGLAAECVTGDAGLAAGTGFVHDWSSCLHISHHAVTGSAATEPQPFFFFLSVCFLVNLVLFLVSLHSFFLPSSSHSLSLQLTKAHRQGHMVKVDWLDRLTFREIEMINEVSLFSIFCSS